MKRNTHALLLMLTLISVQITAQSIIYVAPMGSSTFDGSDINRPTTLANAITLATAVGTTIYLRGGTYTLSANQGITTSVSGSANNMKKLFAYPGDARPILDFSSMAFSSSNVTYGLYRDSARSQPWGASVGVNTASGTGDGSSQNLTAYGRVPAQTTPQPGAYSDTIVVTVGY